MKIEPDFVRNPDREQCGRCGLLFAVLGHGYSQIGEVMRGGRINTSPPGDPSIAASTPEDLAR